MSDTRDMSCDKCAVARNVSYCNKDMARRRSIDIDDGNETLFLKKFQVTFLSTSKDKGEK